MNDTQSMIGKILVADQARDAIHIAVAQVIAGSRLSPGQHIGFGDGGAVGHSPKPIGVVDPFLKENVEAGQRFWMFLYPNTITSLRHNWIHPAFGDEIDPKTASRQWIEAFAATGEMTYNRLMDAATRYAECDDYTYDNTEIYKGMPDHWADFWKHYAVVTGLKPPADEWAPFTCSC